jgi:hypothetical protein
MTGNIKDKYLASTITTGCRISLNEPITLRTRKKSSHKSSALANSTNGKIYSSIRNNNTDKIKKLSTEKNHKVRTNSRSSSKSKGQSRKLSKTNKNMTKLEKTNNHLLNINTRNLATPNF